MAGIYLHIPFCRTACHYCNFHFSTQLNSRQEMVEAMMDEMMLRSNFFDSTVVNTVYFGGGTPSLLLEDELDLLITSIQTHFLIDSNAEITLEANPEDLTEENFSVWKNAGINRLSIGVQSFRDKDLKWMNRQHSVEQSIDGISLAKSFGIKNISVDLIYGLPSLSNEDWLKEIEQVIALDVPHISAYMLTVEEGTALHHFIARGKTSPGNDEDAALQYSMLMNKLRDAGFRHYEISNFAKPGFESQHNSSYWFGNSYLGIGPSAHSYNGEKRSWNFSNNPKYIRAIKEGNLFFEEELLSDCQRYNEHVMISLRTDEGTNLELIEEMFGKQAREQFESSAQKYLTKNRMRQNGAQFFLTDEGKLFADAIASELFMTESKTG